MMWENENFARRTFDFVDDAVTLTWKRVAAMAGDAVQEVPVADSKASIDLWNLVEDLDACDRLLATVEVVLPPQVQGSAWLHVICEETRHETAMPVPGSGARAHMLHLDLPLGALRGAVAIRAWLVDGAARGQGLANGTSNDLLMVVDRPPDSFGAGIKALWSVEYFEQHGISNALSAVDFTGGSEPRLLLNGAVRDFEPLLSSKATHGRTASARQLLMDWIEVDTWVALGRRAAQDAYELDDSGEPKPLDESYLDGWQGAVLDHLASRLGAARSADKKAEAARIFLSRERVDEVRARISHSVAGGSGLRTRIESLAAELPQRTAGEEHA